MHVSEDFEFICENSFDFTNNGKIPTKFIVIAADVVSPYSAYPVDSVLFNGIFPNARKIAKVIPMHKSGSNQAVEH